MLNRKDKKIFAELIGAGVINPKLELENIRNIKNLKHKKR